MALKLQQQPALTHERRVQRLQQLTSDLARAVDLAEEQRRIVRDLARYASAFAEALPAAGPPPARLPRRKRR